MGSPKKPSNYEKKLASLKQTLQLLREEESEAALIETALNYLKAEFDYSLVWIGLYDRVNHRLLGRGGITPNGDVSILKQTFSLNPGDLMEQVVIQQRLLSLPDLREEPRASDWRRAANKFGIQGTVIFPICHKQLCLGVILLGSTLWGVSPHAEETTRLLMVLGALAASLYQLEEARQRQQTKRPAEPLLALLSRLRSLPNLTQRLDAVVQETHRFVSPDRTNVYWFEPEKRYFWRRTGIREIGHDAHTSGFTAQEINTFYQALAADQLVSIGEAHSSLKAEMTGRLMQQIRARSLLAAPILFQDELFGFLAVEGTEPRIWSDEEKHYVRGAAQLIALTAPLEGMEETIQQIKQDQGLTAEISQAIFDEQDWLAVLKRAGDRLVKRLRAERFLVLVYDRDQEVFEIAYQTHPSNRRAIISPLTELNQVDWHMLERSTDAVGIENLEEDLKLMAWRQPLLEGGVRSVLVCNTALGRPLEGLLLLAYETTRTWNRAERDVLRVVSQQVGVSLHQRELHRQSEHQQRVNQTIQWGLTTMQQTQTLERLQQSAMQQIAQLLHAPLALLVTWLPGRPTARIAAASVQNPKFSINLEATISTQTDPLLQWVMQSETLLSMTIDDVAVESRQWLNGTEIGQLLVVALRTAPEHAPTGLVIVGDRMDRYWPEHQLNALTTLTNQLAWARRYLLLTEMLGDRTQALERLNWYKQRRGEDLYRTLGHAVKRLNDLSHQQDALSSMRYHQIVRQLGNLLSTFSPVLKQEQWQLQTEYETMPLVSLLKRAMERVEQLVKQRQLWTQIHNENNFNHLTIGGDIAKIELVLYEILAAACHRSPSGSRLDLWCRPLDTRWLELSLTDSGAIDPRLLQELSNGRTEDRLVPSTLDHPPGLHLAICQVLMQQLGGEFNLYRLEDNRLLSRLVLPIATGVPSDPAFLRKDGI